MRHLLLFLFFLFLSCREESDPLLISNENYFYNIISNDTALSPPHAGEWLYEHHEKGQSFKSYKSVAKKNYPRGHYLLFLEPIGTFTPIQKKLLEDTRQYLEIFFQQKTTLLPTIPERVIPEMARRMRYDGGGELPETFEQYFAPYINDSLLKQPSLKSMAIMAITSNDLYPRDEWNFVFGLASYDRRVGVSSIFRLQDKSLDSANYKRCLQRLIKIASHEICHMLSLRHCIYAHCVMNGTNHLGETDAAPARPCSECQKKLLWNLRYDNNQRLKELISFFEHKGLVPELEMCGKDLAMASK